VVYQSAKLPTAYVFHSSGRVEKVKKSDVYGPSTLQLLEDHSTVFISDSITPACVHAFTVLITSPKRERWSEFNKESDCARLFFPVFSWEEIQQLQEGCFPGVTGVIERFLVWGGIPRYVLAKLSRDDQNQIYAALTSPDFRLLADCLGKEEVESDAAASHRLWHLKVRGEFDSSLKTTSSEFYELCRTELGSTFIADKFVKP